MRKYSLEDNTKIILILGGYGYGNTGDEAQLNESINLLKSKFKNYKIIVLTHNLEYTKTIHNCNVDFSPREAFFDFSSADTMYWLESEKKKKIMKRRMKYIYFISILNRYLNIPLIANNKIKNLIRLLKKSSMVYFAGGGYLTGSTLSRLWDGCLFIRLSELYNIPVVLSGQTIGLFNTTFDIKIAKKAFNYPFKITLRDLEYSRKALEDIGLKNHSIMFDDALFCDKIYDKNGDILLLNSGVEKEDLDKKYISLNIHDWGVTSEEERNILLNKIVILVQIIKKEFYNYKILLIPMTPSDEIFQKEFINIANDKDIILFQYSYDFKEVRYAISKSILCITMKHHPIIFAIGEKVPTIPISYKDYYVHKNKGALSIFGLEKYHVNLEDKNYDKIFADKVSDVKNDYAKLLEHLNSLFIEFKNKKDKFISEVYNYIIRRN